MKVYLAAPYPTRERVSLLREVLELAGYEVTSRWLDGEQDESDAAARDDLADVLSADVFVAFNPADWTNRGTGGRHFEMGFAYRAGKPIVLVGPRSHVFHQLSDVTVLDSEDQLLGHLLRVE